MLKNIHTLTIKSFSLYDRTHKVSYLMRFGFGGRFYKEGIKTLLEEIAIGLAGEANTSAQMESEHHRITSYDRISYLSTLYAATYNALINKSKINVWLKLVGRKPTKNTNLKIYVDKIKDSTGIEIKEVGDMVKLQRVIDRWIEKYHEHFMKERGGEKVLTFMKIVMGVFSALDMRIEYSMPIADFFELKEQAAEMVKKKKDVG